MVRRRSIFIAGFEHENPVPAASVIGQHLVSGVLTGRDPITKEMPADLDAQLVNVFAHVRELMDAADGTVDDISKITVWLADDRYRDREALNREWTAMFPDASSRPARQVMSARFDGSTLVQCDLQAVLAE
ncbi:RidA family protein [Microbacterium sp. A204]|uniref:RidA family protein n=1 Tax=Microbacterium sp. A204 TaxID=3457321 RepID=UPI003FD32FA9